MRHPPLISLLLMSRAALGQVGTATLSGTVTDSTGAVIPGASVLLESALQQFSRSATADSRGEYILPALPPGEYKLTLRANGFAEDTRTGVTLYSGQASTLNYHAAGGRLDAAGSGVRSSAAVANDHGHAPFFVDARYHFFIDQPGAGWRGDAGRAGAGCVLDMGYHLVDIIVWYFDLPDRIHCSLSAVAEPNRRYDAEDTATVQFSYHSGLHGMLALSRYYVPTTEMVTVIGPQGQLMLDPARSTATVLVKGRPAHVLQLPSPPGPSSLIDHSCGVLAGTERNIGSPEEHLQHMAFNDACYRRVEQSAHFWGAALVGGKVEAHEGRARH